MYNKCMNRRNFVKSTTIATSAFALPRFSIAEPGKTKKINVAVVGVSGMGGYALNEAAKENLVAMCDVDDARAANAFKKFPNVPRFKDFRIMLDKLGKEIDAVSISTPDHTHFAAAMAAMERGKQYLAGSHPSKSCPPLQCNHPDGQPGPYVYRHASH
jgi:hypothetical protein